MEREAAVRQRREKERGEKEKWASPEYHSGARPEPEKRGSEQGREGSASSGDWAKNALHEASDLHDPSSTVGDTMEEWLS